MNKKTGEKTLKVILLIAVAIVAAACITLYVLTKNKTFVYIGLLAVGIINILNGFLARSTSRGSAAIFFIGGTLLTLLMAAALIFGL